MVLRPSEAEQVRQSAEAAEESDEADPHRHHRLHHLLAAALARTDLPAGVSPRHHVGPPHGDRPLLQLPSVRQLR